jgi:hypothetical protein
MIRIHFVSLGAPLVALLVLGACGMAPTKTAAPTPSMAPMQPMATMSVSKSATAALSGASEVPAVAGSANGTVDAKVDLQTSVLTWTITYSGLTGPATGGHFHGPAIAGQNAGVVLPLSGSLVSPITGSATLTATQMADMRAGKWYVNLHTAAHPGGEIRGQLMVQP